MKITEPEETGIYPVTLHTGRRTCAMWDGTQWLLWSDAFDPAEWEPVMFFNTQVVEWRMP